MPVNFENHKIKSSVGIKETLRHLSDGKPLGCFPGEVSSYKDGQLMVDKPWEEGAIKVIRKAQVPVVPIYFHAKIVVYFTCYLKLVALFALQNCEVSVKTSIKVRIENQSQ
jgi:putative hemolysin